MATFSQDDGMTPKLEGVFWLPGEPGRRWPGVVQFHSSGLARLILWMLEEDGAKWFRDDLYADPVTFFGEVNEVRHPRVTLAGGRWTHGYGRPPTIGGTMTFEFPHTTLWMHPSRDGCPTEEIPVTANEFRFALEGLEAWLGRKLWDTKDGRSFTAREHSDLTDIRVEDGVDASLRVLSTPGWFSFKPGFRIDTWGEVVLRSREPREIQDFIELAERFQKFMCFVWRRQCLIGEMGMRWDDIHAQVVCPTWLSWFPSDDVDELLPSGTAFTAKEVGPATPSAVLEAWCRMCSDSKELVESIVRVLADSRSTDRRIDLVIPALDQIAPCVDEEEPEWRRGEREKMLAALGDERREWWDERMKWNTNPIRGRLVKLFEKHAGASVSDADRERIVKKLVDLRVQRFHKGLHDVGDDVWFPAVAVLYCAVLDRLGIDWRCFMRANGTLQERRRDAS